MLLLIQKSEAEQKVKINESHHSVKMMIKLKSGHYFATLQDAAVLMYKMMLL
jgi:hypothetical protein